MYFSTKQQIHSDPVYEQNDYAAVAFFVERRFSSRQVFNEIFIIAQGDVVVRQRAISRYARGFFPIYISPRFALTLWRSTRSEINYSYEISRALFTPDNERRTVLTII